MSMGFAADAGRSGEEASGVRSGKSPGANASGARGKSSMPAERDRAHIDHRGACDDRRAIHDRRGRINNGSVGIIGDRARG